ncbi:MAG: hypothetical protein ACI8VT_002684, partial [Saprospiraceae bacterium]
AGVITGNGTNMVTYTAQPGDLAGTVDYSVASGIPGSTCVAFMGNTATPICPVVIPPVTMAISDPCNCTLGLDLDVNGSNEYAQEEITIFPGLPPYAVTSVAGLFDNTGTPLTPAMATALITGPDGFGLFTLIAYVPADGVSVFSVTVTDSAVPATFATQAGGPCAVCCSLDITCSSPGPVSLECITELPAGPTTVAEFNALGGLINDSCNSVDITFGDVDDLGPGCVTAARTVTRTITITDPGTLETEDCLITYIFADITAPTIVCPAPVTVECIEDVPAADITLPVTGDNCLAPLVVTHEGDVSDGLTCPETITRTYRVTDACGNFEECTQIITVNAITNPTIVCPPDVVVECIEDVPAADITLPVTGDNCLAPLVVTHEGDVSDGLTCPETITRTYRVTDACGNFAECIQLITINDITNPTITCPADVDVECIEDVPIADITLPIVGDNCLAALIVTHEGDVSDGQTLPETITRTYRVTDACGNFAECIQLITVNDVTNTTMVDFYAEVEVFPNPFNQQLTVHLNQTGLINVRIFDPNGRLVYRSTETIVDNRFNLSLSNLQQGVFLLCLETPDGEKLFLRRIIKM